MSRDIAVLTINQFIIILINFLIIYYFFGTALAILTAAAKGVFLLLHHILLLLLHFLLLIGVNCFCKGELSENVGKKRTKVRRRVTCLVCMKRQTFLTDFSTPLCRTKFSSWKENLQSSTAPLRQTSMIQPCRHRRRLGH